MPSRFRHDLNRLDAKGCLLGPFDYRGAMTLDDRASLVHRVFERRARELPSHPAVLGEPDTSFAELDALAGRAAAAILSALGEGHEPVLLFARKNHHHFAAFLGVLKSGKCLAAVDASDPAERVAAILDDACARLILCDASTADVAAQAAGGRAAIMRIDALPAISGAGPSADVPPSTPALLAYTSGSTGKPKAVIHPHENFLAAIWRQVTTYNLLPDDRHLHLISANFMMSHSVAFHSFLSGGSLLLDDPRATPMPEIVAAARRRGVTQFFGTPTHLRQLLAAIPAEAPLETMRVVRVAGEPLTAADAEAVFRAAPDCLFSNGYGTTEVNTSCVFLMSRGRAPLSGVLPAGYPLTETEITLRDPSGIEVPRGEIGEIVITKRDISPGYWRRPEESAAVFTRPADPAARATYRTGDLGRILPNGCLENLGRNDRQVKIRGVRIEIGEIEAALLQEPQVAQAVVVPRSFAPGDDRLVAFFLAAPGPRPACAELRRRLSERLPAPYIPALFVQVGAFPHTHTGKIDRAALPLDPFVRPPTAAAFEPPVGDAETALRDMWERLLGIRPIGAADNFFELGGHSLLAAQIMAEIEPRFGVRLPPAAMLRAPTIRALAALLPARKSAAPDSVIEFKPGAGPPFFIVQEHQRQLFRWWDVIPRIDHAGPILGVAPSLTLDDQPRYRPIEEQARRCAEIIRSIQPSGPYRLAGFCHGGIIAFEVARVLDAPGSSVIAVDIPLDTLRFRPLHDALQGWRKLSGASRAEYVARFRRLRARLLGLEAGIARASRDGLGKALASVGAKARGLAARAAASPDPLALASPMLDGPDGLSFAFFGAPVQFYFPDPSGARMIHLISEDAASDRRAAAACETRWRRVACGGVESRVVPGNHSTMLLRPSADLLAAEISRALAPSVQV